MYGLALIMGVFLIAVTRFPLPPSSQSTSSSFCREHMSTRDRAKDLKSVDGLEVIKQEQKSLACGEAVPLKRPKAHYDVTYNVACNVTYNVT